jgi:hypothetical protein
MDSRDSAALKKVEKLLRTMFAREIGRKVPDELMNFFKEMPDLVGSNMIEFYSRYYMMMTRLIEKDAGEEEPKSIWYRLWNFFKKLWVKIKKILIFVLLAAAVIYLVFTINTSGSSKKHKPNFDSIGTVIIDKNR